MQLVPEVVASYTTRIVLADQMPGVRAGMRWLLAASPGIEVAAEAATVAEALAAPGDVVVAGLVFPDGTAADLCAGPRPVVVFTWMPHDEHAVDLSSATAVLTAGSWRARLAEAVRTARARR